MTTRSDGTGGWRAGTGGLVSAHRDAKRHGRYERIVLPEDHRGEHAAEHEPQQAADQARQHAREHRRIVVGATVEERGFDTSRTAGAVHELLRRARELLPGIDECTFVEATAGNTGLGLALVAAHPAWQTLVHA